ncbi:alpha/beta fold hydrolase [Streptomyces sp. NPDC093707]|uniref:alpha/beta fold hydrolase n=1 Tax=Streptomyces sp. NPDC093707 TaxID=3154984 RepID=UPI00344E3561
MLLGGGGATSAVWYARAAALARTHRVHAVDVPRTPGLSVPGGRPLRRPADLMAWLDGLLDGLGADRVALLGHSYGGLDRAGVRGARPGPGGPAGAARSDAVLRRLPGGVSGAGGTAARPPR